MPFTAVHFGAGNIGRGFLAQLYRENDYEIIFLDVHDDTIEKLRNTKSYKIHKVDANGKEVKSVSKFRAIYHNANPMEAIRAISRADIFTCSVGPRRLKVVGPILAGGINRRDPKLKPLAVIACENDQNATDHLRRYVKLNGTEQEIARKVEFANCAIDRIVPNQPGGAGLDVTIERYFEWTVEEGPLKASRPKIKDINWVPDLAPFLERKLFTVNTGHASVAYLGWAAGIPTIHEALKDRQIRETVYKVLTQSAVYLQEVYNFTQQEQEKYIQETIHRFQNPALNDPCIRVARDPMRKLSHNERLTKPARWLAENNHPYDALLLPIEQAFRFQNMPNDDTSEKMTKILATKSAEEATTTITRMEKGHPLYRDLVKIVQRVQASPSGSSVSSPDGSLNRIPRELQGSTASSRGGMPPVFQSEPSIGTPRRPLGGLMGEAPRRPMGEAPRGPTGRLPPKASLPQQGRPQTLPVRRLNTSAYGAKTPSQRYGASRFL